MLSSATNIVKFRQNLKYLLGHTTQSTAIISRHASNKDYSSSDEEDNKRKPKKEEKKSKELEGTAVNRLNQLLASMSTNTTNGDLVKVIDLKKVGSKKQKIKEEKEKRKAVDADNTKNVIEAAKSVAKALGGDVKQTESELLSKLLLHSDTKENDMTHVASKTPVSLSELIVGMKIDKTTKPTDESQTKADYIRRAMKRTGGASFPADGQFRKENRDSYDKSRRPHRLQPQPLTKMASVNLFGSEPLGIFKDPSKLQESPDILETWNKLKNRELKMAITHPPANYFEKMILWTEQGKVWKFPIDNEQGLDGESNVYFADHIFLEEHLEGWCPARGPVRHFMELVCVGLSKNPYITVQDKKDHIMWFKDYFAEKQDILKTVIVEDKESPKELSQ